MEEENPHYSIFQITLSQIIQVTTEHTEMELLTDTTLLNNYRNLFSHKLFNVSSICEHHD